MCALRVLTFGKLLCILSIALFINVVKANYLFDGQRLKATVYERGDSSKICFSSDCILLVNDTVDTNNPKAIAWGEFTNDINITGWGKLVIRTSNIYDPQAQAFAAGYLEAFLTHDLIYKYWFNYAFNEYNSSFLPNHLLRKFMKQQHDWVQERLNSRWNNDGKVWAAIRGLMRQFDGLVAGMSTFSDREVMKDREAAEEILYLLNSVGDLENLNEIFAPSQKIRDEIARKNDLYTDCSALLKILPNNSDIFIGHTTWRSYYAMLRVYKVYDFGFATTSSFSSSPGLLHSKDDFYTLGNGLVIMETTNSILDKTLYTRYITYESLMSWQRLIAANWGARNGKEWTNIFSKYNSGTYNNQWMVLDTTLFRAGHAIPHQNLLWIIEQIPGYTEAQDVTSILITQGYWPSYNIPFIEKIYNLSGYHHIHGKSIYWSDPRAKIFARDAPKVSNLEDGKKLMRSNDFQHDLLSLGDPKNAVSSRYDLNVSKPVAFGGIDSKATSANNVGANRELRVEAICGPTTLDQEAFDWADETWKNISHIGVPSIFNFPWITVETAGHSVTVIDIISPEKYHNLDGVYWRFVLLCICGVGAAGLVTMKLILSRGVASVYSKGPYCKDYEMANAKYVNIRKLPYRTDSETTFPRHR